MGTPTDLNDFLSRLYTALQNGDIETWSSLHDPSVAFNVSGNTMISGRTVGIQKLLGEVFPPVFTPLDPDKSSFGVRWKLMCSDDKRAAVVFEGDAQTHAGVEYNNRYVQLLEFNDDGLIQEVWEFFDTDLANRVLFDDSDFDAVKTEPFTY